MLFICLVDRMYGSHWVLPLVGRTGRGHGASYGIVVMIGGGPHSKRPVRTLEMWEYRPSDSWPKGV